MKDIFEVLIPFAVFVMVIVIVWIASREKLAKARIRVELQKELLSKFSSSRELTEFLSGEGSKVFLQEPLRNSANRVIKLVTSGIVLLAVGCGFFLAGTDKEAAALFAAAGLGLILSAGVSHWLTKRLGYPEQSATSAGGSSRL